MVNGIKFTVYPGKRHSSVVLELSQSFDDKAAVYVLCSPDNRFGYFWIGRGFTDFCWIWGKPLDGVCSRSHHGDRLEHRLRNLYYQHCRSCTLGATETNAGDWDNFQCDRDRIGVGIYFAAFTSVWAWCLTDSPSSFWGLLVTGFGGAIYLISNLGPGPRDGLMTGVQHLTNWPISGVRASIEILVVIAGLSLGGTVGLGTVLFAIGIGPAVSASLFTLNHFFRDTKL